MASSQYADSTRTRRCVNSVLSGLAGRWEQTFPKQFLLFDFRCFERPIYPAMAMGCRALPSILCVDVEITASRPLMATAWGELSWHKEAEVLCSHWVPDVRLFLAAGVVPALGWVWKKGFGQLKAGWRKGIRPGCSSVRYRIFLQQRP